MIEPMNRLAKQRKTREPKIKPIAEVAATREVVSRIRCPRCGREDTPKVKKSRPDGTRVHWCTGCGEWLDLP